MVITRKPAGAMLLCIYAGVDALLLLLSLAIGLDPASGWHAAVNAVRPALLLFIMTRPATQRALQTQRPY